MEEEGRQADQGGPAISLPRSGCVSLSVPSLARLLPEPTEYDPAGHGEQSASDERDAPAPRDTDQDTKEHYTPDKSCAC